MNLKKLGRTLWVIAAVAILAMVLQGCGGDDNGGISQSMHDQVVMERDELMDDVDELQTQLMALLTALGASDNMGAMAEITQLQMDLMNLQSALDSDGDTAAALMEINRITMRLGELEVDVTKAETAAAQMKMMMLFSDLGPVIATSLGDGAGTDSVVRMSTTRDMKKTDMMLDAPYEVTDWNGMSWSRDLRNNDSEMAVVYNNKEADKATPFNKAYMLETTGVVGAVILVAADHGKLIEVDDLPAHVNHPPLMIGITNGVRGMFDGAPGTFLASSTAVSVTVDDDGNATWTGTLTFKPDSATTTLMMKDANYVSLGWWLRTDMDADGNLEAVMAWVASSAEGTDYDASAKLDGLQGKATFMGIAAGKYAIMTPASVNTGASHEAGHFTADAELVADFGADNAPGTVTGTISDFEQDGMSLGDWMVQLADGFDADNNEEFDATMGEAIADTGTGIISADTTDLNSARGTFGDAEVFGTWQARFSDNSRNDEMPGSIGGEFALGAENDLVRMIGAFGADNQVADSE